MKPWLLFAFLLVVVLGTRCTSSENATRYDAFAFASGGAYHPEGFGEWRVTLARTGAFTVIHDVKGTATDYGTFDLDAATCDRLWDAIDAAGFADLASSERAGAPDEVRYTFTLTGAEGAHTVTLWVGDAQTYEAVMTLVTIVGDAIQSTTGQLPVLR
ncbi:MAG: hypothetical protein JXB35_13460 [Anaerolineae bacterium]|nr:hypothetical protein [Anaerolineae bacterium]